MIDKLLRIYYDNVVSGNPSCNFRETSIFNEGWLLRCSLRYLREFSDKIELPFLPCPEDSSLYSEGQLYTPFPPRCRPDRLSETHSRIDGLMGQFQIDSTKSGIELNHDCQYISIIEAKMSSEIARKTTNIPKYSQVSRNICCLINGIIKKNIQNGEFHYIVLYPEMNKKINPVKFSLDRIMNEIRARIILYRKGGNLKNDFLIFEQKWENIIELVGIHFITWEIVVEQINEKQLTEFYGLCKKFNFA